MSVIAERRWRNQPLVRERDERRVRLLWRVLLGLLAAAIPTGLYMVEQNHCVQVQYTLDDLRGEHEELLREERRLGIERAVLGAPAAVERWAEHNASLVRPDPERVVVVRRPSATPRSSRSPRNAR